jgi:hypothetical protein
VLERQPSAAQQRNPVKSLLLIEQYVFRTTGRDIAAPACNAQGPDPGF